MCYLACELCLYQLIVSSLSISYGLITLLLSCLFLSLSVPRIMREGFVRKLEGRFHSPAAFGQAGSDCQSEVVTHMWYLNFINV